MNKKNLAIIIACVSIVLAALVAVGVPLLVNQPDSTPVDDSSLTVELVTVIPPAYMGEQYDLKEIIEMEEGVEYSARVFYQNYDTMEEYELPVTDQVFCQTEDFDVNVLFTAKRGEQTAQRALDIPVNIRADEMDEMFSTSGLAGYADTGIVKNLSTDPQYLQNEKSKTSLVVAYQGTPDHEYGLVIMSMAREPARPLYTDQKWENAAISFWVYNPMEHGIEFQLRLIQTATGLDTDWSDQEDADSRVALPGQWTQIVFSLRKYGITQMLTNQKDIVAVKMQYLGRPAPGEQYSYSMYMDEVDIVDASAFPELDTKPTVSNESIEQGWENIRLDTGWQTAQTVYDHDTFMGEGSTCSLYAQFPKVSTKEGYFVALSPEWSRGKAGMKNLPDMTGGTLTGYFKFQNATPAVEVYLTKRVNNKWQTSNTLKMNLQAVGDGWYKGTLDVYDFEFTTDRNDEIIRICFDFTGASKGSQVWVDTVKFAAKNVTKVKEPATKDWINLPTDGGMSNVVRYSYTPNYKKAEGSVRSVMIVAPNNEPGELVFSPEYGVGAGVISKLPDMRRGTLHAWFYFGDQAPKASVMLYNTEWIGSNKSGPVDFLFEDRGDGWYYGSVPASLLENYYEGDGSAIIRIILTIPAGYTVYVDGLMHDPDEEYVTSFDPNDLFASGIFTSESIKSGSGFEVVTDVTNDSADAVTLWATEKSGWPKVGISFPTPVDFSSYTNLELDVKKALVGPKWVGVYLDYLDAEGNRKRASFGTDITAEGWESISIPLAKYVNADLSKVMGVMVCANFDDGFVEGEKNQMWYDNLRLTVVEPPPTPTNPVATEEDDDLISGSFTATADIAGIRGTLKVSADDAGEAKSNAMLLMWANSPSGWPRATFLFESEQDWSNMDYLTLDTKIIAAHPWVSVEIINRAEDDSLVYSKGGAFDSTTGSWNTKQIPMSSFTGVDLTKVCGIRINVNLQEHMTEGALSQVYVDNVRVVPKSEQPDEPEIPEDTTTDTDLLATSQITYSSVSESTKLEASLQSAVTNGSDQALKMQVTGNGYFQWPKVTLALTEAVAADAESFTVDVERTHSDWNFRVEFLDANDNVLGNHLIGTGETGWQTHSFLLSEMSVDAVTADEVTQIAKVRFSFYLATGLTAGDAMYVDNAAFISPKNTDLIDSAEITYTSVSEATKLAASLQSDTVNNSDQAIKMEILGEDYFQWPKATLTLAEKVPADMDSFTVDVERTHSDWNFRVEFLDENDSVLGNHLIGTGEGGWQTHTFKLSEMSVKPMAAADVSKIAKVRFSFYLATGLTAGDAMYVDNAAFTKQEEPATTDLIDSSEIAYSRVTPEKQLEAALQGDVTNGSEQAIKVGILGGSYEQWPIITMTLANAVSADSTTFTVDVERTCSDWNFRVEFLDASGNVLGNHLIGTGEDGWQTHRFKLSEMSVNAIDSSEVGRIAKVRFTMYLLPGLSAGDAMYIDNAAFLVI